MSRRLKIVAPKLLDRMRFGQSSLQNQVIDELLAGFAEVAKCGVPC